MLSIISKVWPLYTTLVVFFRRYMAELFPTRRKTLSNWSINQQILFKHITLALSTQNWSRLLTVFLHVTHCQLFVFKVLQEQTSTSVHILQLLKLKAGIWIFTMHYFFHFLGVYILKIVKIAFLIFLTGLWNHLLHLW